MQFSPNGPDIPTSLIRAQRDGSLLFIVGAGISKSADLPLFGELVDQVYLQLGQALPGEPGSLASQAEIDARRAGQYDRLIGLLEKRLVYRGADWSQPNNPVRDKVATLVEPKRRARFDAHVDLLDLSRDAVGRPRIITTNFDTIFERAWLRRTSQRLPSSAGQAMPAVGSRDFAGILHLHGRIADRRCRLEATDLVLTSANFGEAYMRSGWASRVVYDLLRRYTLVLVGYSADDPPMRYMLEATEEGRTNFPDLKPAFALVGDPHDEAGALRETWRGKGVQPLIYPAPGHNHQGLYQTLRSWADLAREPLAWAETRMRQIAAASYADASAEDRSDFAFLADEVSSVTAATSQASDSQWIEALQGGEGKADDWTYVTWFRDRLQSAEAARYAARAGPVIKARIARAVDVVLRTQLEPLPELYQQFWLLFVQASRADEGHGHGRLRAPTNATAHRVRNVVARLSPVLRVNDQFTWLGNDQRTGEPANIHDLARFEFEAPQRDWQQQLERWPRKADAEERLLMALDRALCDAVDLGRDADLVEPDGDLRSHDLALVHAPEDGEGLVDPSDRHRSHWRLNQPDANNRHFAPLVRMMTGLWRHLAGRDRARATRIAGAWAERDAMIFKRLGAWAAVEGDARAFAATETYLRQTTRARFWAIDHTPELVRFYCKCWGRLQPQTRQAIERVLFAGYPPELLQRFTQPGHRRYARALYSGRELARIKSAGGRLSREARDRLAALYRQFPDLPREMPIFAHLYSPSWSGSGYSADIRVLDEIDDRDLLASAAELEANNRMEQSDLWRVFAYNEPARAFAALADAQTNGLFPAERWQPLLSLYVNPIEQREGAEPPELADILAVIARVDSRDLAPVAYQLADIIPQRAKLLDAPWFPELLDLWDQLLPAAIDLANADERDRGLSDKILSQALGTLADSLVTMQDALQVGTSGGLSPRFQARFDALAALDGRAGLIARGALLQQMAYLHAIAPAWVEQRLEPQLMEESNDALDLMSVVARSVAPSYPTLFNRLKPAILRALEHERTDDNVLEHLSAAVVGAAFSIIDGNRGFDLSSIECRHALTRMPNNVLSRMAWELGASLRQKKGGDARAKHWDSAVAPFLRDYWPNDVSARTGEVSEELARLPALAGGAFERAVAQILDLVRPIHRHEIRYDLSFDEDEDGGDLLSLYPHAALAFISAIIDRSASPPADLAEVMNRLLEADSRLAADPGFWRLRQMRRAG